MPSLLERFFVSGIFKAELCEDHNAILFSSCDLSAKFSVKIK